MRTLFTFLIASALLAAPNLAAAEDAGAPDLGGAVVALPTALPAHASAIDAVTTWLRDGSPPNWQYLAVGLWLLVAAVLKRSSNVKANEPLELVANILVRVPLVSVVARLWTTPGSAAPAPPPVPPAAAALALLLLPAIAFAAPAPIISTSGIAWGAAAVLAAVGAAIVLAIFVYRLRRGPLDADGLTPAERAHWSRSMVGSFGRPRVGPVAFVALLLLAAAPGCATFAQQPVALQKAEVAALKCGLDGVQATMKQLSPSVLDALAGDAPDWRAQLDQLKGIGINALMCTVAHSLYDALGGDVAQFASLRDLERAVELQLAVAGDEVAPLPTPTRRVLARGLQYLRDGLPPPMPPAK